MIVDSGILRKVSTVLEKAAKYVEAIEAEKTSTQHAIQTKAAEELADKLRAATGEELDSSVVDKLAKLDPHVAQILSKLSGESTGVDQMGEPVLNKTASDGDAGTRLLQWVLEP